MLSLSVKIRKDLGKKVKNLREKGVLPAVVYGPKIKAAPLELDYKDFKAIYEKAGESSLINLKMKDLKKENEYPVLIYDVKKDPLTGKFIHVDFYQPRLDEKTTADVVLVFEGKAPAVKELAGTLVRNIQEIEVRALPQNLPHDIRVNIEKLKTFKDEILVRDLKVPEGVEILRSPDDIVAIVSSPEKVEEELAEPIEEKVEEVEGVREEREKEEEDRRSSTEYRRKEE